MPYETRRKSISLTALGIQVPQTSRVNRLSISKTIIDPEHPSKRLKTEHSNENASETSPSTVLPATTKGVTFAELPESSRNHEHTPPPSPGVHDSQIDWDNINDDIVKGVLKQLQDTGNLPHLIKDLATVLSAKNDDVKRSANAAALLSSRLASFMRRPWSAASPCPIAKNLINIHPRKVYYYLMTCPMRPLSPSLLQPFVPASSARGRVDAARVVTTPSLSNASQDDEVSNCEDRKRAALSPSPEVELGNDVEQLIYSESPATADDVPTPPINGPTSFIISTINRRKSSESSSGPHRGQSPPLEVDEQEFETTARAMEEARRKSSDASEGTITIRIDKIIGSIESDDMPVDFNHDAAKLSLGQSIPTQAQRASSLLSSPVVRAANLGRPVSRMNDLDSLMMDFRRPQSVGFDELEDLLDQC